ncbi:MAG: DNA-processing protein DprA [Lentisphaeria bacterium]|nr:DNA-processing protein DprA [Lentisphaeria bacterium]
MTDHQAYIILNLLNGIGPARANALIEFCGSPSAIFQHSIQDLTRIRGISEALAERLLSWEKTTPYDKEMEMAENGGVTMLTPADEEYPQPLREIHDAPLCLYVRGTIPPEITQRSIAMVGTRNTSPYGAAMARHLAESAGYSSWVTISGLAVGIDTIVHRATLDAGGKTVGVLGSGLARFHPQENIPLAKDIIANGGAVITEFPMTFTPTRHSFPMRNRIISGLSLGTLVVEAGVNSGSLITAAQAIEQGKRIFAVPGEADASGSNGCNALIRKGAVLVENFDHILEEFEFLPGFQQDFTAMLRENNSNEYDADATNEEEDFSLLSDADEKILDVLRESDTLSLEQITLHTNLPAQEIMASLVALEILRRIKKLPNGLYQRIR